MKCVYCTIFLCVVLVGCTNNKKKQEVPVSMESAFDFVEDTILDQIEFTESKIVLPFTNSLYLTKKLKPDTLRTYIERFQNYACGNDYLTYIPFPDKGNFKVIAVPMKCDGYQYRYKLLLVNDSIHDELQIEAEIRDRNKKSNKKITSFEINKDYIISVTTTDQKDNSLYFDYKTYQISDEGKFNVIPEITVPTKCLSKKSSVPYPITSDNLMDLNYQNFTCNIEGMKNYACHDGINYVTLKYDEDEEKYLVLIYTECGDSSYADLIVVHNSRVVSGLTIDSADYTDTENGEYSGIETIFEITQDFTIKLTHNELLNNDIISSVSEVYIIDTDGRFLKK